MSLNLVHLTTNNALNNTYEDTFFYVLQTRANVNVQNGLLKILQAELQHTAVAWVEGEVFGIHTLATNFIYLRHSSYYLNYTSYCLLLALCNSVYNTNWLIYEKESESVTPSNNRNTKSSA